MGVSPMDFEPIAAASYATPAKLLVYGTRGFISRFRSNGEIEPSDVIAAGDG
jgi:hypothetical protein